VRFSYPGAESAGPPRGLDDPPSTRLHGRACSQPRGFRYIVEVYIGIYRCVCIYIHIYIYIYIYSGLRGEGPQARRRRTRRCGAPQVRPFAARGASAWPRAPPASFSPPPARKVECKATWQREFKLPWCQAGPPNHHDDKVVSDQEVVNNCWTLLLFEELPRGL